VAWFERWWCYKVQMRLERVVLQVIVMADDKLIMTLLRDIRSISVEVSGI